MNAVGPALIYRSNGQWNLFIAFVCAVAAYVGAIAISFGRADVSAPVVGWANEIEGIEGPPDPAPPQIDFAMPDPPAMPDADNSFSEEHPAPPRVGPIVRPVVRSGGFSARAATGSGSVRTFAIDTPRPAYPYEARRRQVTGSGVAALAVDWTSGDVREAHMAQSTGSDILDASTLSAFRRWRFKPKSVRSVRIPITYNLTGASY